MVGDSLADIEASRLVGVRVVGFANREAKRTLLVEAGAAAVVEDMRELAVAIAGTPVRAGS
jgi:phosphoglycolate phosphatase-like HAD superfamily hydrolase